MLLVIGLEGQVVETPVVGLWRQHLVHLGQDRKHLKNEVDMVDMGDRESPRFVIACTTS
jgi:hypothetical protein